VRRNGGFYLITLGETQTIFDDNAADVLTGGNGTDWFLANYENDDEGLRDRITDLSANEYADDLD